MRDEQARSTADRRDARRPTKTPDKRDHRDRRPEAADVRRSRSTSRSTRAASAARPPGSPSRSTSWTSSARTSTSGRTIVATGTSSPSTAPSARSAGSSRRRSAPESGRDDLPRPRRERRRRAQVRGRHEDHPGDDVRRGAREARREVTRAFTVLTLPGICRNFALRKDGRRRAVAPIITRVRRDADPMATPPEIQVTAARGVTCDDCFFRQAELCALAGNKVCPTFRPVADARARARARAAARAVYA